MIADTPYHSALARRRGRPQASESIVIVITLSRLVALVLLSAVPFAGGDAFAEGNPEAGARLAYTCLGCHGIEGYRNAYPSYRVPKLGGQKRGYVEAALEAYRAGNRPHPTMQAQGNDLSDQDILDLAAFFEGAETATDDVTNDELGDLDAAQPCLACHGAPAQDVVPTPPTLSGQYRDYLVHALTQYKDGERGGTVMSAFAAGLGAEDIERIARFYSERDGLRTPDEEE